MEDVDGALLAAPVDVLLAQPDESLPQLRPGLTLLGQPGATRRTGTGGAQGMSPFTVAGISFATRMIGIPVCMA
jgi:hypothetical protein